jgi:sterol desaturase/sphingolipid hydroxylase (fatty acid hydroxylase superfamily)
MNPLIAVLLLGYAASGLTIAFLHRAYTAPGLRQYLISEDPHRTVQGMALARDAAINSVVSISMITGVSLGLQDQLFHTEDIGLGLMALEAVAVVYVYDFAYYFVHRFLFHEWKLLRGVHSVHHAARNPRTVDSLLLHPVETVIGLGLMFGSIAVVGGVHLWTFAAIFVLYTTLNVWNHAGVDIPRFPFRTLGVLAAKHDRHHHSMRSGNYASITPLPDVVFGTVE